MVEIEPLYWRFEYQVMKIWKSSTMEEGYFLDSPAIERNLLQHETHRHYKEKIEELKLP
jgi:hypothetical protein